MKRTKIKDRVLPDYTRGEEIFNMVSHIVGGAFGIAAETRDTIHKIQTAPEGDSMRYLFLMKPYLPRHLADSRSRQP